MNIIIYGFILLVLIIAAFVVTAFIVKFIKEFISIAKNRSIKSLNNIEKQSDNISINNINKSILYPYIIQTEEMLYSADEELKPHLTNLIFLMNNMNDFICRHRDKEDDIKIMAEYYITGMLKHIKEYYKLKENGLSDDSQAQLKNDIIKTIDIIYKAYETVLSEFHENAVLTVSSSLEALKASIKIKGLA